MSDLVKKLKTISKDAGAYIEKLEKHNKLLKEGLSSLLMEEDVQSLPSYTLLKMTYSEHLEGISSNNDKCMNYDPFHAPPKVRISARKANTAAKKAMQSQQSQQPQQPQQSQQLDKPPIIKKPFAKNPINNNGPSMTECLLDSKPPSKPKCINVVAKKDDEIYLVEINGVEYLRHDIYLYDVKSHLRIGSIDTGFNINGKIIKINNDPIILKDDQPICDEYPYYGDIKGEKVYCKINANFAQAVGDIKNGELLLWT